MVSSSRHSIFIFTLLVICFLAWGMQSHLLLNWDVSWLMHATQRLLDGGSYSKDFFEINPPLILYLYIPPVVFAKWFQVTSYFALRVYVFFLAGVSFLSCYYLCQKIFYVEDKSIANIFLITLAAVFLIIPVYEFGQREHLLVMLCMPYILLVSYRLQGKRLGWFFSTLIGLGAGLGFGIKPYFLVTFGLVEIVAAVHARNIFYWVRTEVMVIVCVLLSYLLLVYLRHYDYLSVVVPQVMGIYYSGFGLSWQVLLESPIVSFSAFVFLFYLIRFQTERYRAFGSMLACALVGLLMSYCMQKTIWYYHVLPVFSVSLLLASLMYGWFVLNAKQQEASESGLFFFLCLIACLSFYFMMNEISSIYVYLIPASFLAVCLLMLKVNFASEKCDGYKRLATIIYSVAFILLITYFLQNTLLLNVVSKKWLIVFGCFLFLFLISIDVRRYRYIVAPALGVVFLAFPVCWSYDLYVRSFALSKQMYTLIKYFQKNMQHQSVYVLSTTTGYLFPAVDYAEAIPVTRFAFMGWIPAVTRDKNADTQAYARFFDDALVADLKSNAPEFILVDVQKSKSHVEGVRFEFLPYLSTYPQFLDFWKKYHYVTTLEEFSVYKLQVYQRNSKV